jgi:Cu/Ag efflux pump CusA
MRWIIGSSIKFRRLLIAAAVGVVVVGVLQLDDARTDTLPEFGATRVEVQTEALGLSAEEVEQLITVPLEQDLLNGVAFLDRIESVSLPGLSSIVMTFEPGTDVLDARQVVSERLTQAVGVAGLPHVADLPQMIQPLSSLGRVGLVKLTSDDLTPIDMSILARWRIVPRLLGVEGVANVAIWGFRDRQLQVLVDPARLRRLGVTLNDVIRTAGNALEVSTLSYLEASSPGTGGFIDTPNQRLHVFHDQAITSADELAAVPIEPTAGPTPTRDGEPVTLGHVADVVEDHQPLIGDTACGDGECVLLVVERFPDANTEEVTEGVEDALDILAPGLAGMRIDTSIYRPADYVDAAAGNVARSLAIGGLLLLVVLALSMPSWRAFAVAAATVVLAASSAFLLLHLSRTPVDVMVMAGLVAGLLVAIDAAVADVGHVVRRLRVPEDSAQRLPTWRHVVDASIATRTSALYALLIAAAVAVPALFVRGEAGAFLPSIVLGYLLAAGAAMVVALTVTPALGMVLLPDAPSAREPLGLRWVARLRGRDGGAGRSTAIATVAAAALLVGGLGIVPFLDVDTAPALQERDIRVELTAEAGTSLPRMHDVTAGAVEALREIAGVEATAGYVGRAIASDRIVNVNAAHVWVHLAVDADRAASLDAIRAVASGFEGVAADVATYSEERIADVLTGAGADDIAVRVFGEDPEVLEEKGAEVRNAIAGIDGVDNATLRTSATEPAIVVRADIEAARRYGVKPGDVRRTAATLVSGITVGNLFDDQKVFDAVVWGAPEIRRTPDDVADLLIDAPGGAQVRLGDVATVEVVERPAEIRHSSVSTYLDVVAEVRGRDVADVAADVEAAIAAVAFPFEHHAELLGDVAEAGAARTRFLLVAAAALIGVFLLLQAALASWRLATIAFVSLPLSSVGGLGAALLIGGRVDLGVIAGLLTVVAFAAGATISLIRAGQDLRRDRATFDRALVVEATDRQTPTVVTTALAAIAAYAPLAIAGTTPGTELLHPLASVAIGGCVTTALTVLVVVPAAYLRVGAAAAVDRTAEDLDVVAIPEIEEARP